VSGDEPGDVFEIGTEFGVPRRAGPLMNDSATGPKAQNAFSAVVLGRTALVGRMGARRSGRR
jgi:hypothetical protein